MYGYYFSSDEWVLRRQAELLANAGVDAVIFDNTNGTDTWEAGYMAAGRTFTRAKAEGIPVPGIAFLLPLHMGDPNNAARCAVQLREIYQKVYRKGLFRDVWFYWKGKPLVMAFPDALDPADALDAYPSFNLRLEYKLKNGKTVNRFYDVLPNSDAGKALKKYFSTTEAVLGFAEEELPTAKQYIYSLYTEGYSANVFEMDDADVAGLLAAIAADCRAGNMAQHSGYHYPTHYYDDGSADQETDETVTYLEFGWDNEQLKALAVGRNDIGSSISYSMVRVYRSCTNTVAWLKENGLLTGEMMKELEICPEPILAG